MPAKAPIYLKPSNSKKGKKCRLRDILSPDMISPPLGDFRHTVHIGRGGQRDAFGDMSFLQGKYELLPGKGDAHPQPGVQSEFLRANSTGDASSSSTETPSPVLKNAISLPTIGSCQALTLPLLASAVFPSPPEPPESEERVGILQMDALLHQVLDDAPPSPSGPDVLLDLLERKHESSKAVAKANKLNSCYISSFKANGSLDSNASNGSSDSFDSFREDSQDKGFGPFSGDLDSGFKRELSQFSGGWVDRDSGVDDGRVCDFDFEFSREKSASQSSLVQMTGSMLSLELDLGPSILDDVLNIMDQPAVKSRP